MNNYHWNMNSFGADYPPVNDDEIIATANRLIDEYIAENPDDPEYELQAFCERLWESFCASGEIEGVKAVFEE